MNRILAFDLETTNLKGNWGHILVACAKWVGDEKFALSIRINETKGYRKTPASFANDKYIVQELIELINESQATLAHYGDRFDRPFLITRALIHKLATPAPVKLIDTWRYAYKNLALTSNRLETISQALGCIHTKYKLAPEVWQLAQYGCGKSQKVMQEYCENDVDTLINVYQMILPLINDHPNVTMGGPGHCPACVTQPPRVQARGYRYTKSFSVQRYECQHCHTWFDGRREKL